jgi:hypothetical protein
VSSASVVGTLGCFACAAYQQRRRFTKLNQYFKACFYIWMPTKAQKIDYVHFNPVKAGLCARPEDYFYSSARFYATGVDEFNMLTHYNG